MMSSLNFSFKKSYQTASLGLFLFMTAPNTKADLAEALECYKNPRQQQCSLLLIGHIDALEKFGFYCPDGNTSYGFLQEAWAREVRGSEQLQKAGTTASLIVTINKLQLQCKK